MPNTIAQNLARLQTARTAIANAITAKGGTVNNGDGFEQFPADIAGIPSGGGGSGDASKPVRFMDYDGSIVASYTPEEFAELTEMPANPSHDGLTAQGWNWSLTDAKAYVAEYGLIDIGQMYITDDSRTRLYVRIQDGRRSPVLRLYLNDNSQLDVDWGDNTPHSTFTSTSAGYKSERHTYSSAGDYIISIGVTEGSFSLRSSSTTVSTLLTNGNTSSSSPDIGYLSTIRKIEIGDGVTSIGAYAFFICYSLSQITIPDGVTSIEDSAFRYCYSLSQITIPDGVTSIGTYTFSSCYSLSQITIPDSVTSIGDYAFRYCYSLSQITIPDGVTSIGTYTFSSCPSLSQITIPDGVTSIGTYTFSYCQSLSQITIPDSVTSIGTYTFSSCYSLSQITIPDGVTSIGTYIFNSCYSLSQITIPDGVTSIGDYTFNDCQSLGYIKFTRNSPPTANSSNAFSRVPTDCKILVPRGRLSVYKSATNYPSPSTYTYEEYDV